VYDTKLILNHGIWHFSSQYLKRKYVAEDFGTQEQTDVHFNCFINTVFLLSLLSLSKSTEYFCNMQNVRCVRGGICDLGIYYSVPTRLEGLLNSKRGSGL